MPSLIARLLRAVQEDNLAEVKVPPDAGARQPSVAPGAGTPGRNQLVGDGVFLCGHSGHGVNRLNPCMGWPAPRGPRAPAARGLARA